MKMGQLSLGLESGQGQDQHEEAGRMPPGRVGSGQEEGPAGGRGAEAGGGEEEKKEDEEEESCS